ncbi:hypothetical protein D7X98_07405 [bacterium 1XD8-76]|nr:hypothetical protein D7X98_07405 [bacterium 1XD8-76]
MVRAYHVGVRAAEKEVAAVSYRKLSTAKSQDKKEEQKMSIDWEELLGAEGEDLDDAYEEAVAAETRWQEGYDD